MKQEITIVSGDDWQGCYADGNLLEEGHSLDVYRILKTLGYNVKWVEPDGDWLYDQGSLPNNLKDVVVDES